MPPPTKSDTSEGLRQHSTKMCPYVMRPGLKKPALAGSMIVIKNHTESIEGTGVTEKFPEPTIARKVGTSLFWMAARAEFTLSWR